MLSVTSATQYYGGLLPEYLTLKAACTGGGRATRYSLVQLSRAFSLLCTSLSCNDCPKISTFREHLGRFGVWVSSSVVLSLQRRCCYPGRSCIAEVLIIDEWDILFYLVYTHTTLHLSADDLIGCSSVRAL